MRMNNNPVQGNSTYFLKDILLFIENLEDYFDAPDFKEYLTEQRWSMFYDMSIPVGTVLKITPNDGSPVINHTWTGIAQFNGDSLFGLAKKYNSKVDTIIQDNNLKQEVFNWSKIVKQFIRKYKYNNIATSTAEQFFDYINQVKDENIFEYLQNLVLFTSDYEIQNTDFANQESWNKVDTEGQYLSIDNNTPGNKLNIDNIIAGTSASNVTVDKDRPNEQHNFMNSERTSGLNTTQKNLDAQMDMNEKLKNALNKFLESFRECFSLAVNNYYDDDPIQGYPWLY